MKVSSSAINTVALCLGRFEDIEPLLYRLMKKSETIGLGMFDYSGVYRKYRVEGSPISGVDCKTLRG